jgi:carboxyl-terminal processing protease
MRKIVLVIFCLFISPVRADIFDSDEPVIDGLNVLEMSGVFADIYKKLDSVQWDGKDIRIAIESIENVAAKVKVAATDERVMVLYGNDIISNWPRPADKDWKSFGQITTAIILNLRKKVPALARMDAPAVYKTVVGSIMKGVNENGKYIYSKTEHGKSDPYVLTSLGIAGVRTSSGDYILNTIFKGSPADAAGLVDGDVLISANGAPLRDLSDMEVLGLFNGFSSGTIKLKAIGADGAEKSAALRRASVVIADADIVVMNANDKKILQIIIHRISDGSINLALDALEKYKDEIGGIYLDLRGATGDDELAMAKLAGIFLGQVPVARIAVNAMEEIEIIPGGDKIIDSPIVIATSGATSGAAEGIAFAFWENKTGVIIGMPTAGKARLVTRLDLENGGALEILNRTIKSGQNRAIDGRGFFPPVCLSNIRTADQKDIFIVNAKNHDFGARDFNADESVDAKTARKGCPNIKSGSDEDAAALAVAMDILLNKDAYDALLPAE